MYNKGSQRMSHSNIVNYSLFIVALQNIKWLKNNLETKNIVVTFLIVIIILTYP